jgi:hypothetical protein
MLNRRAILDTLVLGCKEGQFVLGVVRPDRSVRTFWRHEPDDAALQDSASAALARIGADGLQLWEIGRPTRLVITEDLNGHAL